RRSAPRARPQPREAFVKVLHVINALERAGAETLVADLAVGLARRGIESDVYLLRSTRSSLERALARQGISTFRSSIGSVRSPRQPVALAGHLRAPAYDVIHAHLFPAQLWAALATRLATPRAPLVTTEHNTHTCRRRLLFKPLDAWMYG